jgi:hypothetical protein
LMAEDSWMAEADYLLEVLKTEFPEHSYVAIGIIQVADLIGVRGFLTIVPPDLNSN